MKKNKGITLIALVITIIILLILAGIVISQLTGENGLIEKAKLSRIYTRESQAEEIINLRINDLLIEKNGGLKLSELANILSSDKVKDVLVINAIAKDVAVKNASLQIPQGELSQIVVSVEGYNEFTFTIGEDLKITHICGVLKKEWNGQIVDLDINREPTESDIVCVLKEKNSNETEAKALVGSNRVFAGWKCFYAINVNDYVEIPMGKTILVDVVKDDIVVVKFVKDGEVDIIKTLQIEELKSAYNLSYDLNGGVGDVPLNKSVSFKEKVTLDFDNVPTREEYVFMGWSVDKDIEVPEFMSNGNKVLDMPESDVKLYAIWKSVNPGIVQVIATELFDTGLYTYDVNGINIQVDAIVYNGNMVLDGTNTFDGSTLSDNVYSFGDASKDTATGENDMAKRMVVLKVNGDLTINENVKLTSCNNENGFGGPKGMLVYCTGKFINNGEVSMTARGALALGEEVKLWNNVGKMYEFVPAVGASGANGVSVYGSLYNPSGWYYNYANGIKGGNATGRALGGGGSGAVRVSNTYTVTSKPGTAATSYSGGTGSGATFSARSTVIGYEAGGNGSKGGNAYSWESNGWESISSGGAGNPGGFGYRSSGGVANNKRELSADGQNGTGGLLIIYSKIFENNNLITSKGSSGGSVELGGGSSGGGSINIFYRSKLQDGIINADGGISPYVLENNNGGDGGNGSVTMGNIVTGNFVQE